MSLPNLFTHARSELAQDAVLAYLLEWARPQYRSVDPELNALGEALLRALFTASAAALGGRTFADIEPLADLTVDTQVQGVDILVRVNGIFALVIEDKVATHEHSGQIERYKSLLAKAPTLSGAPWVVHAVYVKTGNESPSRRPAPGTCGLLMRDGLLAILDRFPTVENQIVREFRQHLRRIHTETESFRSLPPAQWTARAVEGFYGAIAAWLAELHTTSELPDNSWPQWSYQPNPRGGERVCCWCWTDLSRPACRIWLQLTDAATLHFRIAQRKQEGSKPKVEPRHQYDLLGRLTAWADRDPWQGRLRVRKPGRFGGGDSAAVAELTFGSAAELGWLPRTEQGLLDWSEACRRLRLAMQFLDSFRLAEEAAP